MSMKALIRKDLLSGWRWYAVVKDEFGEDTSIATGGVFPTQEAAADDFDRVMNHFRGDVQVFAPGNRGTPTEGELEIIAEYESEGAHG